MGDPEAQKNPWYPCQTEHGLRLFCLMSSPKVSYNLRRSVGQYLAKAGFLAKGEFNAAEAAVRKWPDATWHRKVVTPAGCHQQLTVRYRDALVLFAKTVNNPRWDVRHDLVWGPELAEDDATRGDMAGGVPDHPHGYLSDVCHGVWCDPQKNMVYNNGLTDPTPAASSLKGLHHALIMLWFTSFFWLNTV